MSSAQAGERPRVTLSPTIAMTHADGKPFMAMSTPGGDNPDQALIQMFYERCRIQD